MMKPSEDCHWNVEINGLKVNCDSQPPKYIHHNVAVYPSTLYPPCDGFLSQQELIRPHLRDCHCAVDTVMGLCV